MKIVKVKYVKLGHKRKIELECITDNDTGVSDVFALTFGKTFNFVVTDVSEGKFANIAVCTLEETGPEHNRLSRMTEPGDNTLKKLIGMTLKRVHKEIP